MIKEVSRPARPSRPMEEREGGGESNSQHEEKRRENGRREMSHYPTSLWLFFFTLV
jgi:hypothetical protein